MKKLLLAVGAAMLTVPSVQAATIVNLDSKVNAGTTAAAAGVYTVPGLTAGTYTLTFTEGTFKAFNRWGGTVAGCGADNAGCYQGYENSVKYVINGVEYNFGDKLGNGGSGAAGAGLAYYATADQSLAAAAGYSTTFTLGAGEDVKFYIYDTNLSDNVGGVSLAISAVPEPATWAMMIFGFGAVGAAMRRRKTTVSAVRFA